MLVAVLGSLWLNQICGANVGSGIDACDSEATAKPFGDVFGLSKIIFFVGILIAFTTKPLALYVVISWHSDNHYSTLIPIETSC